MGITWKTNSNCQVRRDCIIYYLLYTFIDVTVRLNRILTKAIVKQEAVIESHSRIAGQVAMELEKQTETATTTMTLNSYSQLKMVFSRARAAGSNQM